MQIPVEEVCTRHCACSSAQWETVQLGESRSFVAVLGSVAHSRQLVSLKHFTSPSHLETEASLLGREGWARVLGRAGESTLVLPHYPMGSLEALLRDTPQLFDEEVRVSICVQVAQGMSRVTEQEAQVLLDGAWLAWRHVHLRSPFDWAVELVDLGSGGGGARLAESDCSDHFEAFERMLSEMNVSCVVRHKNWEAVAAALLRPPDKPERLLLLPGSAPERPPEPAAQAYDAAMAGDAAAVRRLLAEHGKAVAGKAVRGAAKGGRSELLFWLLEQHPRELSSALNACGSCGRAALVFNLLELPGANPNRAAIGAAFGGHRRLVLDLLELGADLEWCVDGAARGGHRPLLEELLLRDAGGECLNVAVAGAAEAQLVTLTKWLLEQPGAEPNSALFGAAAGNRHELVAYLLEEYAGRVDVQSAIDGAEKGRHERLRESLRSRPSTPNATPSKRK